MLELAAPVEFFDEAAGAAPLFFDLDEELEEDAGAEEGLHVFAGCEVPMRLSISPRLCR